MAGECLVIAVLIWCLSFGFFHAKRKNWGFAVLPVSLVPTVLGLTMYVVGKMTDIQYSFLLPMVLIVSSLTVSCIWIGISSVILVKTRRLRVYYLVVSVGFSMALSFILLFRYYWELCM